MENKANKIEKSLTRKMLLGEKILDFIKKNNYDIKCLFEGGTNVNSLEELILEKNPEGYKFKINEELANMLLEEGFNEKEITDAITGILMELAFTIEKIEKKNKK